MNDKSQKIDVCIIGGGFAGLNVARLLSKEKISTEVFTSGFGASQLWVGTFDFLKYSGNDIEDSFNNFKNDFFTHPYALLTFKRITAAFSDFFSEFSSFTSFKEDNKYTNKDILTLIGNLKPCVGVWSSIFHNFEKIKEDTKMIIIDFHEFNNSAMQLVAKSLNEKFHNEIHIITLSFTELLNKWEVNNTSNLLKKLSEFKIGNYFDNNIAKLNKFVDYIIDELNKQSSLMLSEISYILLPPILGVRKNTDIIRKISSLLDIPCYELAAFSPSLMSRRLINEMNNKINPDVIKIHQNNELIDLKRTKDNDQDKWELTLKNSKNENLKIISKYVVLAHGSLFHTGLLEEVNKLKNELIKYNIEIPNEISPMFELVSNNPKESTNLYICGSATYTLNQGVTDEIEIRFNTGLGLAISTSYIVAMDLVHKLKNR